MGVCYSSHIGNVKGDWWRQTRWADFDDIYLKLPKDFYNKKDFETPTEVLNRLENKDKIGVETLDGGFIHIKIEEWDKNKHKPLKLYNSKRLDENNKLIEKKNIIKRKRINVFNKKLETYESIFEDMLEPFHTIIDEVLLKCKLNGEIVRIPSSKYRELKKQNIIIECLIAPKDKVPVYGYFD